MLTLIGVPLTISGFPDSGEALVASRQRGGERQVGGHHRARIERQQGAYRT
jgi:hypothetical protein